MIKSGLCGLSQERNHPDSRSTAQNEIPPKEVS